MRKRKKGLSKGNRKGILPYANNLVTRPLGKFDLINSNQNCIIPPVVWIIKTSIRVIYFKAHLEKNEHFIEFMINQDEKNQYAPPLINDEY